MPIWNGTSVLHGIVRLAFVSQVAVASLVGEVVLGEPPTVAADGTYVSSPASEAEAEGFCVKKDAVGAVSPCRGVGVEVICIDGLHEGESVGASVGAVVLGESEGESVGEGVASSSLSSLFFFSSSSSLS